MKSANVVFLIDIQNGFARNGLTEPQGGSLYVPGGENAGEPAARLIRNLSGSTIVLSQDFHPADHISFATNHAGVLPFSNIYLRCKDDGPYLAIGAAVDGKVLAVSANERGNITHTFVPTSWCRPRWKVPSSKPCGRGIASSKPKARCSSILSMAELPASLIGQLEAPDVRPVLNGSDSRGNSFYVVRKGVQRDLDSYGIAIENDGVSKTEAPNVFRSIALRLKTDGINRAVIHIGGLATNFCVEFSHADLCREFVPALHANGIESRIHLLTDVSYGIPIAKPDRSWPDLGTAPSRMASMGTKACTTEDVARDGLD
ncbi:MAG TPA: hypothetical protein VGI22_09975 [Xanthobacteraceae bacterium]|jgi:nicotinamidase-related amidase